MCGYAIIEPKIGLNMGNGGKEYPGLKVGLAVPTTERLRLSVFLRVTEALVQDPQTRRWRQSGPVQSHARFKGH